MCSLIGIGWEARPGFTALIAGPAEVVSGAVIRMGDAVDLLPGTPPHITHPDFVGPWTDRKSEGIAHSVGDDPARIGVGTGSKGVIRKAFPGVRIDPQNRTIERGRIGEGAHVLCSQRTAFGQRRSQFAPDSPRRIPARILRIAALPPVSSDESGPITRRNEEVPFRPESEIANRVTGELLAPIRDQRRFVGHRVAVQGQFREPAGDHAPIRGGARRSRTRVAERGPAPARDSATWFGIPGIQNVEIRASREIGVESHPEQASVPEVVDLFGEIGENRRRRIGHAVEDVDHAGLLGDDDATVRREGDRSRQGQPREDFLLLKAVRQGSRPCARAKDGEGQCDCRQCNRPPANHRR